MTAPPLFGKGLSFPPRVGPDGRLVFSSDEANIRESIRLVLLTEPGERLLREPFGCGLKRFLFEPNTVTTRELIRQRIVQAIGRWEPRVGVEEVTVEPSPDEPRMVMIGIVFRLIATQTRERLALALELEG